MSLIKAGINKFFGFMGECNIVKYIFLCYTVR